MEFKRYKLGEFIESVSDTTQILKDKVVLINTSDVENGYVINHTYTLNKNLKGQFKKRFKKGDILYSEIRPRNRRFAYIDFESDDYIASTKLMVLRNKGNIDNEFLFQLLKSNEVIEYLQLLAESRSGTFPQITFNELANTVVSIPSMENQQKISRILTIIDNKIRYNTHTNDNLFEISRMDFEKLYQNNKLWNECRIDDLNLYISDYVANGSFKSLSENVRLYDEKEYALFIRNTDLKVNFTQERKYVDKHSYDFLKKSQLFGRELIISNVGDVGSIFLCPSYKFPMSLGNNVIMVDSKNLEINYNYYLYYFFKSNQGQHLIDGITGGSAQPKFNKTDFRASRIRIPSKDELEAFNKKVIPMYNKIELNIFENETLAQLRDTLLPKLMNGEIDLDKIEI